MADRARRAVPRDAPPELADARELRDFARCALLARARPRPRTDVIFTVAPQIVGRVSLRGMGHVPSHVNERKRCENAAVTRGELFDSTIPFGEPELLRASAYQRYLQELEADAVQSGM